MTFWFTADPHFGHNNIIRFCNRPFATADEMDATLIKNWNAVVQPNDTVYVLGDFAYRHTGHSLAWYRWQLNGDIILIVDNHDDLRAIRKAANEVKDGQPPRPLFKEIIHGFTTFRHRATVDTGCVGKVEYTDTTIVLCHYPMRSWEGSHHGSWHLFGHVHGHAKQWGKSLDAGVDSNNYRPISLKEVAEKMAALPTNPDLVTPRAPDDLRPWSKSDLVPGAGVTPRWEDREHGTNDVSELRRLFQQRLYPNYNQERVLRETDPMSWPEEECQTTYGLPIPPKGETR